MNKLSCFQDRTLESQTQIQTDLPLILPAVKKSCKKLSVVNKLFLASPILAHCSTFIPPENVRKPKVL